MIRPRPASRHVLALHALLLGAACTPATSASDEAAKPGQAAPAEPHAALTATGQAHAGEADEHCAHHAPPAAAAPLPGLSLYHLPASLTDQRGEQFQLNAFRGQPVLIAMFYSSCTSICPMLIGQLQRIESSLAPEVRAQTRVLLVSLDPERDRVDQLAALAQRHSLENEDWHFTRTSESSVRDIAALLGVRYRRMPDGEINHSPLVGLLDRDGLLVSRLEGALADPAELAAALAKMVLSASGS